VRVLGAAIEANHCAYAVLKADPLVANLRTSPEFSQLLSAASQCQKRFLPTGRTQLPRIRNPCAIA